MDLMILLIISMLIGAVLGMRFKVLVLFPGIFFSSMLLAAAAVANGSTLWSAVLSMVLSATGLQIGFLGGVATRFVVAAARTPRPSDVAKRPRAVASGSAR
jgi:hypothetical protein